MRSAARWNCSTAMSYWVFCMPRLDGAASCLDVVSSNQYAFESNQRQETSHLDLSSEFRENPSSSFFLSKKDDGTADKPFYKEPGSLLSPFQERSMNSDNVRKTPSQPDSDGSR